MLFSRPVHSLAIGLATLSTLVSGDAVLPRTVNICSVSVSVSISTVTVTVTPSCSAYPSTAASTTFSSSTTSSSSSSLSSAAASSSLTSSSSSFSSSSLSSAAASSSLTSSSSSSSASSSTISSTSSSFSSSSPSISTSSTSASLTQSSTSSSISSTAPSPTYLGCWTEQPNVRTLSGTVFYSDQMTIEMCKQDCFDAGYLYAGVEYSRECWCGNTINTGSVEVADSSCSMLCDGNQAETCGGPALLNIYDSGVSPTTSTSTSSSIYSGPTTVPSVGSCYFVGCYSEATNSRALIDTHYIDYSANGMTVEKCAASCGLTYSLFGVEWSGECYCGNTLQAGSVLMPIEQCQMNVCDGDNTEYCGGPARLGVYYCPPPPTTLTATSTIDDFVPTVVATSVVSTYTSTVDAVTITSTTTVATITTCIPQGYVTFDKRDLENGLTTVASTSITTTVPLTEYLTSISITITTPLATFTPTTTVTAAVTYTSNVCPTPSASCNNQGLQWAYYDDAVYNDDVIYSTFDPTVYKDQTPQITGVTSTLGGINTDSNPIVDLYGSSVDIGLNYFALNHVGYIFAPLTGTYTFVLPCPDDIDFVWIGQFAYSGYTRDNANIMNDYGTYSTETYSIDLVAGNYYPLRIMFAQAQGPAIFQLSLTDPSGTTMLSSDSSQSPFLVQYSCDGVVAPAFIPWGSEI